MRKITVQKDDMTYEIDVSPALIGQVSNRLMLPADAISDQDIVKFVVDAATQAFDRAAVEYLRSDGKDT
jgi:hypothetical protein